MYEGDYYQFDAILARMLSNVSDDLDKRQGSVIYDALAPVAIQIAETFADLETNIELFFISSSSGDYLVRRASEWGVNRLPAVAAVRTVESNVELPVGTRLLIGTTYFTVTTAGETALVTAEVPGTSGNVPGGAMTLLDTVQGATSVTMLDKLVIPGVDIESEESLRERTLEFIRKPRTSGNKADYETWALQVAGVGDVTVEPLWNGPGTVRLHLIDTEKRAVTPAVAALVKQYINPDETPQGGMGEGQAPIGALLTVVPGVEIPINVTAKIVLAQGATVEQVRALFIPAFEEYLRELAYKDNIVRLTRISGLLLGIPPILDYSDLMINGTNGNIQTLTGQVAVPGTVTFNVN